MLYLKPKADGSGYEEVSFLKASSRLDVPKFSPDGRYVVYRSDESGRPEVYVVSSGRPEVYVVSFPGGSGRCS